MLVMLNAAALRIVLACFITNARCEVTQLGIAFNADMQLIDMRFHYLQSQTGFAALSTPLSACLCLWLQVIAL